MAETVESSQFGTVEVGSPEWYRMTGRTPPPPPPAPAPTPTTFDYGSVPGADLFTVRPQPSDWPYGPYGWTLREKERIAALPIPPQPSNYPYGPATWRAAVTSGRTPSEITTSAQESALAGSPSAQFYTDRSEAEDRARRARFQQSMAAASEARPGDWAALIEALGGVGGGGYTPVQVNRELFRLTETPEEAALLARELADIDARSQAGRSALTSSWARLEQTNRQAAEKARSQVLSAGDDAARAWTDASIRATELAQARAEQAGAFAGRQAINVSPTGGAEDFIMFMESQAPAARQYAERTQETLASDLDWMTAMAGQQGAAYAGELQRQAAAQAFQSARDHNRAVQERINAERMALAQMEFQASATNAQLAQAASQSGGASAIQNALTTALLAGDAQGPGVLAAILGVDARQALALYNSAKSSPLGVSLINQAQKS